jgi:hypothetical protein
MRAEIDSHEQRLADDRRCHTLTFARLAELWIEHGSTVGDWKPATTSDNRSMLKVHLRPAFADLPIGVIDDRLVRRWWRSLHDPRRPGGPLSDRTPTSCSPPSACRGPMWLLDTCWSRLLSRRARRAEPLLGEA